MVSATIILVFLLGLASTAAGRGPRSSGIAGGDAGR
jgi:hypothetical protein